jgi:hypothetical protein
MVMAFVGGHGIGVMIFPLSLSFWAWRLLFCLLLLYILLFYSVVVRLLREGLWMIMKFFESFFGCLVLDR